jgi:glycosyltransferase involved in cell wall biosynthesis
LIRILVFGLSTGIGGVEAYLMNLYRNIDQNKVQFDFVVAGNSCYYSEEIESLGGRIYYITPKKNNVIANILDLLKVLKKCKRTHRIIYFNLSALYYNLPFIFAKLYQFPIVIAHGHTARDLGKKKDIRYYLHCLNSKYVSFASNYLLACSKLAGEWVLGSNAIKSGNVRIVPNAIPTEKYYYDEVGRNRIRSELGIKKGQFVIGNVGRLTHQKNQLFLLDIFKVIHEKNKNAFLLLIGEGELRLSIEEKVSNLGLNNNVLLTGARSDVPGLFQAMDVFLLPSLFEGLGIVLIEGQTSGLRCFTSKDVVPEEVDLTGLVEFINLNKKPEHWAEQILKCSVGYNRKSKTKEVKNAGYDIKEMAKDFQDFITSINGKDEKS